MESHFVGSHTVIAGPGPRPAPAQFRHHHRYLPPPLLAEAVPKRVYMAPPAISKTVAPCAPEEPHPPQPSTPDVIFQFQKFPLLPANSRPERPRIRALLLAAAARCYCSLPLLAAAAARLAALLRVCVYHRHAPASSFGTTSCRPRTSPAHSAAHVSSLVADRPVLLPQRAPRSVQ